MDTTPEYVKMCQKAVEIQTKRELHFGDLYYSNEMQIDGVRMERYHIPQPLKDGDIWLPRQDQLQDMVQAEIEASYIKRDEVEALLPKEKEEFETCTKCGGIGRTPNHPHILAKRCDRCGGSGKVARTDYKIYNQAIDLCQQAVDRSGE